MPRRTRRWSFVLGVLLMVGGFAMLAKPLTAGASPAAALAVAATPQADDAAVVESGAPCCRHDRRRTEFHPGPAVAMLALGGAFMLAAGIAAGGPYRRSA